MSIIVSDYETLVADLYDAALDPARWDAALAAFARYAQETGEGHDERMALLMPHMVRAMRLFQRRRLLQQSCGFRTAALDRIAMAVLVVEPGGPVQFANSAAQDMLRSEPVASALQEAWAGAPAEGTWLRLPPAPGREAMVLVVAPMACAHPHANGAARLVMVTRLRGGAEAMSGVLREMFALTPAEVRVALAVADGSSIADVAARHRIKEETVRGQLKDVFSKLGVRRQSELARFVGRMGMIVPHEEASTA